MLGVKRILCPTDFSEFSRRALAHAVALAKWSGAEVTLLHVAQSGHVPVLAVPAPAPALPIDDVERARLQSDLESFAKEAEGARVTVRTLLLEGDPVTEILARAEPGKADLVVMGTHGARGFERLVLGSVTEKVLRKVSCPVITVPRDEKDGPNELFFGTVLCAVDLSDCSERAMRTAAEIARETKGSLVLLHVLDFLAPEDPRVLAHAPAPDDRERAEREAETRLAALLPGTLPRPERLVRGGRPYREILRAAEEREAGLIVMGVQGRGAIDLMLFGSTTHNVIREARCPVLTVRTAPVPVRMAEVAAVPALAH